MAKSRKNTHTWSEEDNIMALYYYKFKTLHLGLDESEIAKMLGTNIESLKIQATNFRRLQTVREGLSDFSKLQASIYEQYGNCGRYELFSKIKEIFPVNKIISERIIKLNYPHRDFKKT
tara:strand:- start:11 stop:367 length:357 start_codon:yes stop_codon:yes gene_type:complete